MTSKRETKRKAVALKYIEGTEAPMILAKGEGRTAQIMLEEAEKKGIPVTEDKVLVDLLGLSSAGDFVPENTWQALAVIFSYILNSNHSENPGEGKNEH
jgi:type III secretion system FlhB-like substrate exporter